MDHENVLAETDANMHKGVEYMIHEFSAVRTGKASPALVENIDIYIQSYGTSMKLKQLALITTPEPRLILIQPHNPPPRRSSAASANRNSVSTRASTARTSACRSPSCPASAARIW